MLNLVPDPLQSDQQYNRFWHLDISNLGDTELTDELHALRPLLWGLDSEHWLRERVKLLKPIGIRIEFSNSADGDLEKVTFTACNIGDNPELSKVQTLRDKLIGILERGPMTVKELSEELDKPESTIRMELNRKANKSVYVKRGNQWGLLASGHE